MEPIAIVGIDGREDYLGEALLLIDSLPPEQEVFTIDTGEFHLNIKEYCESEGRKCTVVCQDKGLYGTEAAIKRDVELAKAVNKVVAFWDLRNSEISLVVTMAKLYGKLIQVNPHEDGGILSDRRYTIKDFEGVAQPEEASASNTESEGSNPSALTTKDVNDDDLWDGAVPDGGKRCVTRGICGFGDEDDGANDKTGEESAG